VLGAPGSPSGPATDSEGASIDPSGAPHYRRARPRLPRARDARRARGPPRRGTPCPCEAGAASGKLSPDDPFSRPRDTHRNRRPASSPLFPFIEEKTLDHPSLETMARLLASDLSHEELLREVIPHLLDRCPERRRQNDEILRLQKESGHWDERVALHEWRQAPELLTLLEGRSIDEQLILVTDDETFQTWGFCQLLLRESLKAAFEDAERAINLAELAVRVSQTLDEAYDPGWVLDLRARAHAYLGNSQRVLGELRSAETAFREAEKLLAQSSTGNDLARAEVIYLKSSLLRAQRRLGDAMALVEQALTLYREQDDAEGMGNAFLKKAKILEEQGNVPGAIEALRRSIGLATPRSRLDLYARHNMVLCLAQAGRYEEADRLLAEIRETFDRGGQPLDLLRLR